MSDNQPTKDRADNSAKSKFINAAENATRDLPRSHKIEFLCPCCGKTAFIARPPDFGDQYAWCECGMKYYAKSSE